MTSSAISIPVNPLRRHKNLSDVDSVATARANLGLGTGDTPVFVGLGLTGNLAVDGYTQLGIDGPRLYGNGSASAALWTNDESGWADFAAYGISLEQAGSINWGDVLLSRGSGLTVDSRATGGFRSRNSAGTASAPITASTGAFSDTVTSGSFGFGFDASVGSMRVHQDAGYFVGSRGKVIAPGANLLRLCADDGTRFRNYANTADTPITAQVGNFTSAVTQGLVINLTDASGTYGHASSVAAYAYPDTGFIVTRAGATPHLSVFYNVALGREGASLAGNSQNANLVAWSSPARTVALRSDVPLGWSATTDPSGTLDTQLKRQSAGNLGVYASDGTTLANIEAAYHKGTHFGYLAGPTTGLYVQSNAAIAYVQGTQVVGYNNTAVTTNVTANFGGAIRSNNGNGIVLATDGSYAAGTRLQNLGVDGKLRLANYAATGGVYLDTTVANTLKIRNLADNADGALTAGAITASASVEAPDLRAKTTGVGYVAMSSGSGSISGLMAWYKSGGTRRGYMGYDADASNNISMVNELGGNFAFTGGITASTSTLGTFPSGPPTAPLRIAVDGAGSGFTIAGSATEYTRFVSGGILKGITASGSVPFHVDSGTAALNLGTSGTTRISISSGGDAVAVEGIGLWGVTPPAVQPTTPVTLADVITILQSYGLCA